MKISLIIPVSDQEADFSIWLSQENHLLQDSELIFSVVKGSPIAHQLNSARLPIAWKVIEGSKGRARQLNRAAEAASGDYLWFLHFDSRIEGRHLEELLFAIKRKSERLFYFQLGFYPQSWKYDLNALGTKLRSRFLGLPFGDQAYCLSARTFWDLGGFDETRSVAEDHHFLWTAKLNKLELCEIPLKIFTSARKYEEQGWVKTTLEHLSGTAEQAIQRIIEHQFNHKRGAVVVFLKSAELSPVKTRLAQDIGVQKTKKFYELCLQKMNELEGEIRKQRYGLEFIWAVAEENAVQLPQFVNKTVIAQGEGELGDRLFQIQEKLKCNFHHWIFIGMDSPQLSVDVIAECDRQLKNELATFTFGKAIDGGFYLYGARECLARAEWNQVSYSQNNTAEQLLAILSVHGKIEMMPTSFDVDELSDLNQLADALELKVRTPIDSELLAQCRALIAPPRL